MLGAEEARCAVGNPELRDDIRFRGDQGKLRVMYRKTVDLDDL